jgi:uncharacterized ubiquitin-like protein YukD
MDYVLVTVENRLIGKMDVRLNRKMSVKQIIYQLFSALSIDPEKIESCCMKAVRSRRLLFQTDTLESCGIYDGEILKII